MHRSEYMHDRIPGKVVPAEARKDSHFLKRFSKEVLWTSGHLSLLLERSERENKLAFLIRNLCGWF